ncbi:activity-dependent neuroprotector homeobox protein 2 [Sarcophilus harrisii]|uniref:ADNP homeobox 2 n=1 Tax=Sarcophilus harrisii TaxID=9305 RepID=A0A7N4NYC9_SARHA|nr:activity-dependent neuroprotector homeobox protein 2 [Sarcophilus harrisii]XP_023352075.1 activity-dependent neuroprotector homeobox protein 2 [Sarcophilus harrisii]XP_023352076.1 activity-dependent neuroprotector homeobox protein 2 [Sarcophilus harrisii]
MFQNPVENLDNIRKVRKKVKGILLDIGLDSCKELLKDLKDYDPGEKYFYNTSWGDVSPWESSGKRKKYRTKPYCCSLCKYSTKLLSSLKNHLHRYHEDEIDQELVVPCSKCVFASQPKVVEKHFRMFHSSYRKIQNYPMNILGESKSSRSDVINFTCLKCHFTNTLYYSMKKHVLIAHFNYLITSYFGMRTDEMPEQVKNDSTSLANMIPSSDKYYCKKCNIGASSLDALMYHILTSDTHRDLENRLRSVISEHIKKTGLLKQMHIAPKLSANMAMSPLTSSNAPALTAAASTCIQLALPQNNQNQTLVQSQAVTVASSASGTLTHSAPAAAQSHVTLVSSPLPVGQNNIALKASVPQPVFVSHGLPLNQPVSPTVLPLNQPVGSVNKSVGAGVLPINQTIHPGLLPLNQSVGPLNRPVGPGVLPINRPIAPNVLPVNQPVASGVIQGVPPRMISMGKTVPSGVLPVSQAVTSGVLPVSQPVTSGVLPVSQSVTSGVLPVSQTVTSGVLPVGQTVPSGVLPMGQKVSSGVLPVSQAVPSGVLPVGQAVPSGVLQLNQSVMSGVLPVSQAVRPGVLHLNQPVTPGVLPVNQPVRPNVSQNATFLTAGSILRQLIPTGKQVNGIPTYTLAPVSVTLPVPPGGVANVTPPQMPIQLMQSSTATQISHSPAGAPSPPIVVSTSQNMIVPASSSTPETSQAVNLKQAKQWKTCPVCNELFPSNVYQVHMEVAHKHSGSRSSEKLEPEKLAACAPFLRWMKEKSLRCISCKCLISEEELMHHLLMHGLGCLFCKYTFHNIRSLSDHNRTVHLGKKRLSVDYSNRGFQVDNDANGDLIFPHIDFITMLPKEELGEREVYLAILAGMYSKTVVPIYIKVRPQTLEEHNNPGKQVSTCPFCLGTFVTTEKYEIHLKERHHVMPTVHTFLKSPAFKCIHCCGVYTGKMTLTAITVHLLRCRSAPKVSSSALQIQPDLSEKELPLVNGEIHDSVFPVKRKLPDLCSGAEDQRDKEEPLIIDNDITSVSEKAVNVPSKKQKNESRTEGPLINDDALHILALNPQKYEDRSYEEKKQFLKDYFHKRPYPSKKEIELLSSLLWVWKIDVASFFGKRRYTCLRAIKNYKPSVLLGFDMSELKNVKHRLHFECETQTL